MTTTVEAVGDILGPSETFEPADCVISYLPLAHAFERGCQVLIFCSYFYFVCGVAGSCIGMAHF